MNGLPLVMVAIYLCTLNLTSPHLTSPHLTSPHLTSPNLTLSCLTSPHLVLSCLASPHLSSVYLTTRSNLTQLNIAFALTQRLYKYELRSRVQEKKMKYQIPLKAYGAVVLRYGLDSCKRRRKIQSKTHLFFAKSYTTYILLYKCL